MGNGITIDLMNHLGKSSEIDTGNLFRYGSMVPWPGTNKPGFLSYKYCPNLWHLGARSTISNEDSLSLIEQIIQCANVYGAAAFLDHALQRNPNDIHIKAYHELLLYLRYLFVHYDKKVGPLSAAQVEKWPWLKIIRDAINQNVFSQVTVVTYCYDIWLERSLTALGIPFYVSGFESPPATGKAVEILKPHGSISFCYKNELPRSAFTEIKLRDFLDHSTTPTDDFTVNYQDLDRVFPLTPLIPPAGQSRRFGQYLSRDTSIGRDANQPTTEVTNTLVGEEAVSAQEMVSAAVTTGETSDDAVRQDGWANTIRKTAMERAQDLAEGDELILGGLSYWHVDRDEIDGLLAASHPQANVKMVNPSAPQSLNAVLTSLFPNYIHFSNASVLSEAL